MAADQRLFDRTAFVSELGTLCHSLGAPYSRQTTEQILAAIDEHLEDSVLWLRCTSKPADAVNFRIARPGRFIDTTIIAANAGWISNDDSLAQLVQQWCSRADTEQWCDFDPGRGITKTWIWFRYVQPLEKILSVTGLPATVKARLTDLQALDGLKHVTFTAVDYHKRTINIYFLVPEPLTFEQAAAYTSLAGSTPSTEDFQSMKEFMEPMFTFAITIGLESGHIPRVAFYPAVKNTTGFVPRYERLRKFFDEAPSHGPHEKLQIVSWSFGAGDSVYMKGETNYAGNLEQLGLHMFFGWAATVGLPI